jgi:diguanylate cyclase (GGDEF)-like protein
MNQKILVADDEVMIHKLIARALTTASCEVVTASDGVQALALIEKARPDLVVLDINMPGKSGWEVLRELKSQAVTSSLPVIMLTGYDDSNSEVAGLELGADDYITKPFQLDELRARVMGVLRRNRVDLTANPLTHLPGSPGIEAEVNRRIAAQSPFAFLYADIDNFKPYNDHYGFARGDEVIRAAALMLADSLRSSEAKEGFLGHVGGDDFVMMTEPALAAHAAQHVVSAFDRKAVTFYDATDMSRGYIETADRQGRSQRFPILTLSIGVVSTINRALDHYAKVVALAAEMKTYCKSLPMTGLSRFAFDRRQDQGLKDELIGG